MVNIPKQDRKYCRSCNKYTTQAITQYKKSKDRKQAQGTRRYNRKQQGCHGQTKPILRRKAKVTKKLVLKYKCKGCTKVQQRVRPRTKHVEFGGSKKIKGEALVY